MCIYKNKMSSIFDLKTNVSELSSSNQGIAKMSYDQHPPTRDVTNGNFANGAIHFRWQNSGQSWWLPNRSYLRLRFQLTKADGVTPLTLSDGIAPNMGLCASLFQSAEFRINDKTISRISDFMPQVDALETRLTKSRSWLNGVGSAVNFWKDTFKVRQSDVVSDAGTATVSQNTTERATLGYDVAATVGIAADTGVLTFAVGAGAALPVLNTVWAAGDEIEIECGGNIGTVRYHVSALPATAQTLQLNNLSTIVFGAAVVPFRRIRSSLIGNDVGARKACEFEVTWTPPLSIFKIGHAMPSGKYELILNPQTSSVYQKAAIESTIADKTAGAGGDFKFNVSSLYMYVNTVEGPRSDDITYLLDLEQTRCQSDKIDNVSFQQKNWDVSPSTYALSVAYQDLRAGSNSLCSVSKFKSYNSAITTDSETKLNRFFINYAGSNLPSPDADPDFTPTRDYTVQRYVESQMYSGAYYNSGSPESIQEFHNRGSYYYFSWPRDGTDRSTRVSVHQQFSGLPDDVVNMRVLLFDHSKQVARVRIQDGRVVDVQLEDN